MNSYQIILALCYFKEKKTGYVLSELMEILGYTHKQLNDLIEELFSKGYICYIEDLISITNQGLTFLITNDCDDMSANVPSVEMVKIDPSQAIGLDYPYVPKKFDEKYKG